MEKLIELLNEYEKEIKKSEFYEWEQLIMYLSIQDEPIKFLISILK